LPITTSSHLPRDIAAKPDGSRSFTTFRLSPPLHSKYEDPFASRRTSSRSAKVQWLGQDTEPAADTTPQPLPRTTAPKKYRDYGQVDTADFPDFPRDIDDFASDDEMIIDDDFSLPHSNPLSPPPLQTSTHSHSSSKQSDTSTHSHTHAYVEVEADEDMIPCGSTPPAGPRPNSGSMSSSNRGSMSSSRPTFNTTSNNKLNTHRKSTTTTHNRTDDDRNFASSDLDSQSKLAANVPNYYNTRPQRKSKLPHVAQTEAEKAGRVEYYRQQTLGTKRNPKFNAYYAKLNYDLYTAVDSDNLTDMSALLRKHACATFDSTPLHYATSSNMIYTLVQEGGDVNSINYHGHSALMNAILKHDALTVQALLDNKADVNADVHNYTPLTTAISHGDVEKTQILIDYKANLDVTVHNTRRSVLTQALKLNNAPMVQLLVNSNANVNKADPKGRLPIAEAITWCPDAVSILQDAGVNMKLPRTVTKAFVDQVTKYDQKTMTRLLDGEYIDMNSVCSSGQPMVLAAMNNVDQGVAITLIRKNADVSYVDAKGRSLLCLAVIAGKKGIVDALIHSKCDVNHADEDGMTPLMFASKKNLRFIVDRLVEVNADVCARNNKHRTAHMIAKTQGHREIYEKLQELRLAIEPRKYTDTTATSATGTSGNDQQ
jgi:ankyrin repeat protein